MPQICEIHSFVNTQSDCKQFGGVRAIKYCLDSQVDYQTLNNNYAGFNTSTWQISTLPNLLYGSYKELLFYRNEAKFDVNIDGKSRIYNVTVENLTYQMLLNPKELKEVKNVQGLTLAVLLNSGQILIFGLHFDADEGKFISSLNVKPFHFSEQVITSDVQGSELGLNAKLKLSGGQYVPYHIYTGSWSSLNTSGLTDFSNNIDFDSSDFS